MNDYIGYFVKIENCDTENEKPFIITADNDEQAREKAKSIARDYSFKISRIILVREDKEIRI